MGASTRALLAMDIRPDLLPPFRLWSLLCSSQALRQVVGPSVDEGRIIGRALRMFAAPGGAPGFGSFSTVGVQGPRAEPPACRKRGLLGDGAHGGAGALPAGASGVSWPRTADCCYVVLWHVCRDAYGILSVGIFGRFFNVVFLRRGPDGWCLRLVSLNVRLGAPEPVHWRCSDEGGGRGTARRRCVWASCR